MSHLLFAQDFVVDLVPMLRPNLIKIRRTENMLTVCLSYTFFYVSSIHIFLYLH